MFAFVDSIVKDWVYESNVDQRSRKFLRFSVWVWCSPSLWSLCGIWCLLCI